MNLSTYTNARSRFFSSLESIGELSIVGPDIEENVTLKLKDLRALVGYSSAILSREPIITNRINLMTTTDKLADETRVYDDFIETTKLNDKFSFYFQATTFSNKVPLTFRDRGLLGESNTYRPFNSLDSGIKNTMTTASIEEIRTFSEKYFKFKNFRGIAAFRRASLHEKGYTIYLSDKDLYMTIISCKYDIKAGTTSYLVVLYVGD